MFPNNETHIYLLLNPDFQTPLYRSPGGIAPYVQQHTLEAFKEKHTDWEEREKGYQEWRKKQSEYS